MKRFLLDEASKITILSIPIDSQSILLLEALIQSKHVKLVLSYFSINFKWWQKSKFEEWSKSPNLILQSRYGNEIDKNRTWDGFANHLHAFILQQCGTFLYIYLSPFDVDFANCDTRLTYLLPLRLVVLWDCTTPFLRRIGSRSMAEHNSRYFWNFFSCDIRM